MVKAQESLFEMPAFIYDTTIVNSDTLIAHIHPKPHVFDHLPTKKVNSSPCVTDSVVTKDSLGNYIEKTEYFYSGTKDAGTTTWKWVNGTKIGVSKTEKSYDSAGREVKNASFLWNPVKHDWKLTICNENAYDDAGRQTDTKLYIGQTSSGKWKGSTYYHYEYNESGQQVLSLFKSWSDELEDWTEQNKWEYEFVDDKPSSTSYWIKQGDQWVGSQKTVWEYSGERVINEEQYVSWVDGEWIGGEKVEKTYNSLGQITLQLEYIWSSGWVENLKIEQSFDGSNQVERAVYTKYEDQWVGSSRTTSTFDGSAKLSQTTWTWNGGEGVWEELSQMTYTYAFPNKIGTQVSRTHNGSEWINVEKTINEYNSNKYITQTTISKWIGEEWIDSIQTRNTYNSSNQNILTVKAKNIEGTWVSTDSTRWVMEYQTIGGKSKKTLDEKATWSISTGWKGTSKYTYVYDAVGNTLQYDTYSFVSGQWINNQRQQYEYKDNNASFKTLEQKMTWNNSKQLWEGNSKTEKVYDDSNRTLSTATYEWSKTEGKWKGKSKTATIYEDGVAKSTLMYQWNTTLWDWSPKSKTENVRENNRLVQSITYQYDETVQAYVNQTMVTYSYDESGRQYRTDNYAWQTDSQVWCSVSHNESTYDEEGGKLRSQVESQWKNCERQSLNTAYYYYQCDHVYYIITWLSEDSAIVDTTVVERGDIPYHEDLSKESTAQYTYSFKGWTPAIVAVTGDATYMAEYDSVVNRYRITWLDTDDTELAVDSLAYGATPSHADAHKANTAEWTYSFVGWTPAITSVTGDAIYKAQLDSVRNRYLITFKNGDETLQSTEVEYGVAPVYTGEMPSRPATAEYTYTFAGWDAELAAVTGEATYNATFSNTLNKYLITFKNGDETLQSTEVEYGVAPVYTGEMPSRPATAEYSYTFVGWDKPLSAVTADETYTAQYDSVRNKYSITFLFDDGETVMETVEVEYGQTPATTITPSKMAEEHYYYTFIGWTPAVVPVTGEATYTAIFDTIPQEYLITFKNYNGTVLQKTNVPYGTMPEYTGATPQRPRTQQYSYEFVGWSPELTEVAGATTYTAQFEAILNQYTVVFLDEDGTELDRQIVDYGTKPVYQGETPVKAEDEQYTYTFAGWYPAVVTVTKDATYYATYTAHDKSQGLWGVQDGEPSSTKIIRNGTLYILRAGKTYTTDGVMVEQ